MYRIPNARIATLAALTVVLEPSFQKQPYSGPAFELTKIAGGVYVTAFKSPADVGLIGNSVVIVNDSDVVVVDSHNTPATARAVIKEIRKITPLPVRYVITTHWHGDHIFGNQVYKELFPGVDFIAHPHTQEDFVKEEIPGLAAWLAKGLPDELSDLKRRLSAGKTTDGKPFSADQRTRFEGAIERNEWLQRELHGVQPVLATLTVADSLVLQRGERSIVVRHLGRGNTRGDLTIYLPRERVLITGDLLVYPMPYGGGSYPTEWVKVLGLLREIPADVIVPGHGQVQHDHAYLDLVVALLESTSAQAQKAVAQGMDLEATRKAVNIDSLRTIFTGGNTNRYFAFDANYTAPAVERAWREARGELDAKK